jgi:uncharacterized protein
MAGNLLSARSRAAIAGYVAFAPAGTEAFFHDTLPSDIGLIDACLPNLGDCLLQTIQEIFAREHAAAVVLNSDSPTLPTALLVETAEILAPPGERAVLGPSTDGGYYLLGLRECWSDHSRFAVDGRATALHRTRTSHAACGPSPNS